ncbi:hypothetical protein SAMN04487996_102154 [Dyadobacter soli]|uniref:Uncharacterized protein n=1 Tax=Dyadobacter soli TaxID=659014 RepID=A0A1G6XFV1_9BACT|nr:hypothetical protein SAMN04487996_102154 [Dyadobacter soli]
MFRARYKHSVHRNEFSEGIHENFITVFKPSKSIDYWKVERSSSAIEGLLTNFFRSLTVTMRFLRK